MFGTFRTLQIARPTDKVFVSLRCLSFVQPLQEDIQIENSLTSHLANIILHDDLEKVP